MYARSCRRRSNATAIRSCTAPTSRSRESSASSRAARSASPSAPRSAARTTSCRSYTGLRRLHHRPRLLTPTAARATSTRRTRRWRCRCLKNVELNGALALRPLHRCRQLADAEVRRQVACAATTSRCAARTPRRSGRRRPTENGRSAASPRFAAAVTTRVREPRRPAAGDHRCELQRRSAHVHPARQPGPRAREVDQHHARAGVGASPQRSSITADIWQIKRKGCRSSRIRRPPWMPATSPATRPALTGATDIGAIAERLGAVRRTRRRAVTEGLDVDAKSRFDLGGGNGALTVGATWTPSVHADGDGTERDRARVRRARTATATSRTASARRRDRVSFYATWELAQWRLGANVNYRGSMSNKASSSPTRVVPQHDARRQPTLPAVARSSRSRPWTSRVRGSSARARRSSRSIQNVFDTQAAGRLR